VAIAGLVSLFLSLFPNLFLGPRLPANAADEEEPWWKVREWGKSPRHFKPYNRSLTTEYGNATAQTAKIVRGNQLIQLLSPCVVYRHLVSPAIWWDSFSELSIRVGWRPFGSQKFVKMVPNWSGIGGCFAILLGLLRVFSSSVRKRSVFFKDFGILQILGRCLRSVVACGAFSWRHGAGRGQCWKLVASTHDEAKGGTRPPNDKTKENERKGGNALRLKEWGARRGKKWCGWMSPYIVWQRHMTSQSPLGALYCTWRNHSVLSASWLATSLAVSRFNTAAGSAITSDIRSGAQGCRTRLG